MEEAVRAANMMCVLDGYYGVEVEVMDREVGVELQKCLSRELAGGCGGPSNDHPCVRARRMLGG